MRTMRAVIGTVSALLLVGSLAGAQSLADVAKTASAPRVAHAGKVYTNADLRVYQPPARDLRSTWNAPSAADIYRAYRRSVDLDRMAMSGSPAPMNPYFPFLTAPTPIAPLSEPWSSTTYLGRQHGELFVNDRPSFRDGHRRR